MDNATWLEMHVDGIIRDWKHAVHTWLLVVVHLKSGVVSHVGPVAIREVARESGSILLEVHEWSDFEHIAHHKGALHVSINVLVVRIVEEHRVNASVPLGLSALKASVHESEVLVALLDRSLGHRLPLWLQVVRLVRRAVQVSVLPGEGIEGGQLHPPAANLLLLIVRVARTVLGALEEAADIGSDVRHAEHVEVE